MPSHRQLDIAGAPFDADRRYAVAAAVEQDVREGENRRGTGARAVEVLREYFRRRPPVDAGLTHSKFVAV